MDNKNVTVLPTVKYKVEEELYATLDKYAGITSRVAVVGVLMLLIDSIIER